MDTFTPWRALSIAAGAFVLFASASAPQARVTKMVISQVTSPLFNGQTFGSVGQYEMLRGIAYGEIDPTDRRNSVITDIAFAPRNANGRVEYNATFTLSKPIDMTKASGTMLYTVVNRGNTGGTPPFHIGGNPGDGFTYNRGLVLLWSGWQGDLIPTGAPGFETINVPIAKNPDGSPITGPAFARFINVPGNVNTYPLAARNISRVVNPIISFAGQTVAGYAPTPATLDTTKATLISKQTETRSGVSTGVTTIASSDWAFADCTNTPFPGTPDPTQLCLKNGFDPNLLYQLVYTARDPLVLGIGMAAMRDIVSFFHNAVRDDVGTANPIAGKVGSVIAFGSSQSGRFIKHFINLGFNEDENGQKVWDGANPNIPGGLGQFNIRFANPGNIAEIYEPGAEGPLWWEDYADTVRNRTSWGILHRCRVTNTCPLITETYGGPEYWYGRGSIGISGTTLTDDIPVPANVRRYYHPSTTHGGGNGSFLPTQPTTLGLVEQSNPNPETETNRALFVGLSDWVTMGILPPPSAYPRVSDGTLVPANSAAMGWPSIPGHASPDGKMLPLLDYDFGPQFNYNDVSGVITNVPPPIKQIIVPLVPRVDVDGNEIAGVRSLLLRLPLGTYLSWNPIAGGSLKGENATLSGGFIPFARTRVERIANGDPRLSIEERYTTVGNYYFAASAIAKNLIAQRLLLPEDGARVTSQALQQITASGLLPLR